MTEFGEEPTELSDEDGPTELERELAREVDRPAPLFARKEAPAPDAVDPIQGASAQEDPAEEQDVDQSIATIQGEEAPAQVNGERAPYDTEADGSPVVGDLLKIRFVEHHVVPTILVSCSSCPLAVGFGWLWPESAPGAQLSGFDLLTR